MAARSPLGTLDKSPTKLVLINAAIPFARQSTLQARYTMNATGTLRAPLGMASAASPLPAARAIAQVDGKITNGYLDCGISDDLRSSPIRFDRRPLSATNQTLLQPLA